MYETILGRRRFRLGRGCLAVASFCYGLVGVSEGFAQSVDPSFNYVGNALTSVSGDRQRDSYSHNLTIDAEVKADGASPWAMDLALAWTAGNSLSERAIGDLIGVQGTYNGGNALWLYKAAITYSSDARQVAMGRVSAGDWFAAPVAFGNLVNGAFSSNGGAVSINDPGRPTSPSSSWGAVIEQHTGRGRIRLGAFLSDPGLTDIDSHGTDLTFRPSDGVIAMAEASVEMGARTSIGVGGYYDTARFDRFDGVRARGNFGGYGWIEYQGRSGPQLTGMIQVAPRDDRSVLPVFGMASAGWTGLLPGRSDDVATIGAYAGRISRQAGLGTAEGMIEANYQIRVTPYLTVQPDMQFVIHPSGRRPNAMVLGIQTSIALQKSESGPKS